MLFKFFKIYNYKFYKIFILFYVYLHITASGTNEVRGKACPFISIKENENGKILTFQREIPKSAVGFSVDLLFSGPVIVNEAMDGKNKSANVTKLSEEHWVISVFKVARRNVKMAVFTANVAYGNVDTELTGVVFNGVEVLCGNETSSKVISPKSVQVDDAKKCVAYEMIKWENSSKITLKMEFYSIQVGFVVDIFFDAEVDDLECDDLFPIRHSKNHFSFFNNGIITSKDEETTFSFEITHSSRPVPEIEAIVMNDVVICGFSPIRLLLDKDVTEPVSQYLKTEEEKVHSMKTLLTILLTFCSVALISTLVLGVYTWKIVYYQFRDTKEPIYSLPNGLK